MSAVPHSPNARPADPTGAPQLRTILLTDLCDSTALVERLGDAAAAELFRAHDTLVLVLQQTWRGRLIDRSDGLLLLFERPIDGLGFALDYVRGLAELGRARKIELRARAGLHVGEVLTWRNSDEAVRIGAKPLEVEGLAKPMAARLMTMARPGQVLLSAVAEPLAHRAARELGERGHQLLWKSWGRWRFKGVPEPQEIFEVGEPGLAPLRAPPAGPKAWRDIPLWRRPAALAAQAAVVGGLAIGGWFVTRPQPAIAFGDRDWVVVGDLRNLTGQPLLDDSLEQAFRISLEQSRHVNVLSDLKSRETLARMQRAPDTALDRGVASEIALRDGARAVILPTVSELGGRVRVSAEVIDPHSQATVYSESADGQGIGSTLQSIDRVTAALRGKLGENLQSVERDSAPLPQVTTSSLDALRAYALGQKAYGRGEFKQALQFYERATALDPQFALGWMGQMRVRYSQMDTAGAVAPLRRALALKARLAPREAMYLDAWAARFDAPAEATGKWVELARLYPDFAAAQTNAALWLAVDNRFKDALGFAQAAATSQGVDVGIDYDAIGRAHLALGDYRAAARDLDRAIAEGYRGALRRRVAVEAARGDFAAAARFERQLRKDDRHTYLERVSLAVDRGDLAQARALAATGVALAAGSAHDARSLQLPAAVVESLSGNRRAALASTRRVADAALAALAAGFNPDAEADAALALGAALVALRDGDDRVATDVLAALSSRRDLAALPAVAELTTVVRAEQVRLGGRPQVAIDLLTPLLSGNERYQTRVALMKAYRDAGQADAARAQSEWLQRRRGLAYVDNPCGYCLQALNVADARALRPQTAAASTRPPKPATDSRG
ncbi:putative peptide modification system cyclase [Cognatilysobacter tabacisoli]|uniref:putative peptide modification system cyclase n=1 Tax=Cognatilysobacter tabacisoli TaxID=2315424 RepID=UPI000E6AF4F5|nr:putative peptide modification system cyclase [Lysobacter tabacisoli]